MVHFEFALLLLIIKCRLFFGADVSNLSKVHPTKINSKAFLLNCMKKCSVINRFQDIQLLMVYLWKSSCLCEINSLTFSVDCFSFGICQSSSSFKSTVWSNQILIFSRYHDLESPCFTVKIMIFLRLIFNVGKNCHFDRELRLAMLLSYFKWRHHSFTRTRNDPSIK